MLASFGLSFCHLSLQSPPLLHKLVHTSLDTFTVPLSPSMWLTAATPLRWWRKNWLGNKCLFPAMACLIGGMFDVLEECSRSWRNCIHSLPLFGERVFAGSINCKALAHSVKGELRSAQTVVFSRTTSSLGMLPIATNAVVTSSYALQVSYAENFASKRGCLVASSESMKCRHRKSFWGPKACTIS